MATSAGVRRCGKPGSAGGGTVPEGWLGDEGIIAIGSGAEAGSVAMGVVRVVSSVAHELFPGVFVLLEKGIRAGEPMIVGVRPLRRPVGVCFATRVPEGRPRGMALRYDADFLVTLVAVSAAACALEPPEGSSAIPDGRSRVSLGPDFGAGRLGPVLRIDDCESTATLPRLFVGELSDYHRARADLETLPSTLAERQIALWKGARSDESAVALGWLEPGQVHSLVVADGVVVPILPEVDPPRLRRVWPPSDATVRAAYCDEPSEGGPVVFGAPSRSDGDESLESALSDGTAARWRPLDSGRCWLLDVDGALDGGGAVSPLVFRGAAVEPTWFKHGDALPHEAVDCAESELPLTIGCVSVQDDRLIVRGPADPTLWTFAGQLQALAVTEGPRRSVVRGLVPSQVVKARVRVHAMDGNEWSQSVEIRAAEPRPHVVINEVLANPIGAEPAQEWIELYNDGAEPVNLRGWTLSDGTGESVLPDATLGPGRYALMVTAKFDVAPDWDVVPAPGVLLLSVSAIGKGGLANSGEPLRLSTSEGVVVSRFPPLASPGAGVSLARREPWLLDDDDSAVAEHGGPGASPGAVNVVD